MIYFYFSVEALYRHQHSEFVQYLYLVAPINLIILNPFGFAMMELGKEYNRYETTRRSALMGRISRNIICNPVVFMTALGMIANLVFNHDPPKIITTFLGVSYFLIFFFFCSFTYIFIIQLIFRLLVMRLLLLHCFYLVYEWLEISINSEEKL